MRRSVTVIGVAITVAWCSAAPALASPTPTAKPTVAGFRYSFGYGHVKPTQFGAGKRVLVCRIHWYSWGGQIALGIGVGSSTSPTTYKLSPAPVVVWLYGLTSQGGKSSYTKLYWAPVPIRHGQQIKAC